MAKLTKRQWDKIKARLDAGEKPSALAKEYGVTRQAIHLKFNFTPREVKEVANQIVAAEQGLQRLNKTLQLDAINLANTLLAISNHVGEGARYGAMTFHRLAGIANQRAQKLDDIDPDPEELLSIAQLTDVGNKAAQPALNLLAANKKWTEKDKSQPGLTEMSEDDYIRAIKEANERLGIGA